MTPLLKHHVANRLKLSLIAVFLAFAALSAGDAQAVCSVVNGACGGGAATCNAGSVTGDGGQTSCGTTRTWGCMGTGGGTTASCSVANAACPINGGWSSYGSWGSCSVSCGGGTQTRSRTCTNPAPANGGATCSGSATESQSCNTAACPVNGVCNNATQFSCSAGSSTANVAGSCGGNSTWTCSGSGGGTSANCSKANAGCPVNGACYSNAPWNDPGCNSWPSCLCSSGSVAWISNCIKFYDGASGYYQTSWNCMGANGGSNAYCGDAPGVPHYGNGAAILPPSIGACPGACTLDGTVAVSGMPCCSGDSDGNGVCGYQAPSCVPNWYVAFVGACWPPCTSGGGGSQDIYYSDGCGGNYVSLEACSPPPCI